VLHRSREVVTVALVEKFGRSTTLDPTALEHLEPFGWE
jgi:hypothetical protein